MHDKDYQNFLKFTNECESLTFEEVVEIYEKLEMDQLTDDKDKDTSVPSGNRGKPAELLRSLFLVMKNKRDRSKAIHGVLTARKRARNSMP